MFEHIGEQVLLGVERPLLTVRELGALTLHVCFDGECLETSR